MTRTRLLGQQERGREEQRESERSWASDEGKKLSWVPEEGGQRALEGLWRQECIGAILSVRVRVRRRVRVRFS